MAFHPLMQLLVQPSHSVFYTASQEDMRSNGFSQILCYFIVCMSSPIIGLVYTYVTNCCDLECVSAPQQDLPRSSLCIGKHC